jgi:hypothetical protein
MSRELTQFKPGADWNGNPNGRPKGSAPMTTLIRRALDGNKLGAESTPDGRTVAEWLVDNMISHAMKGNAACMKEIMDRVEGKIPDPSPPEPLVTMETLAKNIREKKLDKKRKKNDAGPRDHHGNDRATAKRETCGASEG